MKSHYYFRSYTVSKLTKKKIDISGPFFAPSKFWGCQKIIYCRAMCTCVSPPTSLQRKIWILFWIFWWSHQKYNYSFYCPPNGHIVTRTKARTRSNFGFTRHCGRIVVVPMDMPHPWPAAVGVVVIWVEVIVNTIVMRIVSITEFHWQIIQIIRITTIRQMQHQPQLHRHPSAATTIATWLMATINQNNVIAINMTMTTIVLPAAIPATSLQWVMVKLVYPDR